MMATAAKMTVAQVENLVEPGQINPDHIIKPGVFVKRIVHVPNAVKHIEQRTVRKRVVCLEMICVSQSEGSNALASPPPLRGRVARAEGIRARAGEGFASQQSL